MQFHQIYRQTEDKLRLAMLSLWTLGNHPMRHAIEHLFDAEPFLAEPCFQSNFGWVPVSNEEWRQTLHADVIEKLEIGRDYPPYQHQFESWKAASEGKSIVVTSGTGSGKTECFMYPVLSDIYEQEQQEKSHAIRAIFLYPLNALMEDQKNRLNENCQKLGLKFAVYNGNTAENAPNNNTGECEISTRKDIRARKTRPQILLSNPSMLEYILVRKADQEMLDESRGKLRWLIIDESHTYSGSAAVELAFQIRRILDAFGMSVNQVRFACTSATMGAGSDDKLKEAIAFLTGQNADNIAVIHGSRLIPEISSEELESGLQTKNAETTVRAVTELRRQINQTPGMMLHEIWDILKPSENYNTQAALQLVDSLCDMRIANKPVLSVRAHLFMRTVNGLYACGNEQCPGSSGTQFGHITAQHAIHCPHCGSPLLEIMQCKQCRTFVLSGEHDGAHHFCHHDDLFDQADFFALDDEEEDLASDGHDTRRLYITPKLYENKATTNAEIIRHFSFVHNGSDTTLNIDDEGGWTDCHQDAKAQCPACGAGCSPFSMKHLRIPVDFVNRVIAPVILSNCAPDNEEWGKYIAFTDSRQGTAISAKTFNIDVERNGVRSALMRKLAQIKADEEKDKNKYNNIIEEQIKAMEAAGMPPAQIEQYIALFRQNMSPNTTASTGLSLYDTRKTIFNERIFKHFESPMNHDQHEEIDYNREKSAYQNALMRSYVTIHALYQSDMESMGLIRLIYPKIEEIHELPENLETAISRAGLALSLEEWKNYLILLLNYFVRVNRHIQKNNDDRKYVRNSTTGKPFSRPGDYRPSVTQWPCITRDKDGIISPKQTRMVLLLCAGLGVDDDEKLRRYANVIDLILQEAFEWLNHPDQHFFREITRDDGYALNATQNVGCYYMDMSTDECNRICKIKQVEKAWICPVFSQLLSTVFYGYSPLFPHMAAIRPQLFARYRCTETIDMPSRPNTNKRADIENWLDSDPQINNMKCRGLWTDRYEWAYKMETAYLAAEHSAQQNRNLLKHYVEEFKRNDLHVLQCSTTMEMGVDIGDVDVVMMDTIPPTSANYLQRVGRAGRMKQARALAFSICNHTAVAQSAFRNPMWAMTSPNRPVTHKPSRTIIQRHVNSFFLRSFINNTGDGIEVKTPIQDFMDTLYDPFVTYLRGLGSNQNIQNRFQAVFNDSIDFSVDPTINAINTIYTDYTEIRDSLLTMRQEATNRQDEKKVLAIEHQIERLEKENLLSYLSEHQFIPNANMPTGIVEFNFMDNTQAHNLVKLKQKRDKAREDYKRNKRDIDKNKAEEFSSIIKSIYDSTTTSRDVRTALNEYAPGQTVVINEKNYISAGIMFNGIYTDTQSRAIFLCKKCGYCEYTPLMDNHNCPRCGSTLKSVIDNDHKAYTRAYEPAAFRVDQNMDASRKENTEKTYYDIRPFLLNHDPEDPEQSSCVPMCQITGSNPEHSEILFYNAGTGNGFAFCKKCGRSVPEKDIHYKPDGSQVEPELLKPGHRPLWWSDDKECDATQQDIARNVVFTGRHQTCYAILKFFEDNERRHPLRDIATVWSLGVILKRALCAHLGIDENEIDFGVKKEYCKSECSSQDATDDLVLAGNDDAFRDKLYILYFYDTAKGGCGYSIQLYRDPNLCRDVFQKALELLQSYPCDCHESGGACSSCLIDRQSDRYAHNLDKKLAMDWLLKQTNAEVTIPQDVLETVREYSHEAQPVTDQTVEQIVRQAIDNPETESLLFCVSDKNGADFQTWASSSYRIGKLIRDAKAKGKRISLKMEFHPELHTLPTDNIPFIELAARLPEFNDVELVQPQGTSLKPLLIVNTSAGLTRYFTENDNALSFSDDWGNVRYCFRDHLDTQFTKAPTPIGPSDQNTSRIELSSPISFTLGDYFKTAILENLSQNVQNNLRTLLENKSVTMYYSDKYVNNALIILSLVHFIKELQNTYHFTITRFNLNSSFAGIMNERYKGSNYFNDMNITNKLITDNVQIDENCHKRGIAEKLVRDAFLQLLSIADVNVQNTSEHDRTLIIDSNSDDSSVTFCFGQGIGGFFHSDALYSNIYIGDQRQHGRYVARLENTGSIECYNNRSGSFNIYVTLER